MSFHSTRPTRFTAWRDRKKLTMEEIAQRLQVSRELVRQFEQGISRPSPKIEDRLSRILGVSVQDLHLHFGEQLRLRIKPSSFTIRRVPVTEGRPQFEPVALDASNPFSDHYDPREGMEVIEVPRPAKVVRRSIP